MTIARTLALVIIAAGSITVASAQQARDTRAPLAQGSAVVGGVVTIAGTENRPARGAVITLNHTERLYGDTTVTDDQGRFEFTGVPAGRYLISGGKSGYLETRLGATRPERQGTPIAIADGQRVLNVNFELTRGAVLSGTVRDADGEAVQDVQIAIQRVLKSGDQTRFVEVYSAGGSSTDDRGTFRVYGLPPGDYVVQAYPARWRHEEMQQGAHVTTAADISWARTMLQPGGARSAAPPQTPSVVYSPVYYPNTVFRSSATVISVGAGEERGGLDLSLPLIPTYRVTGVVTLPSGAPPEQPPGVFLVQPTAGVSGFDTKEARGAKFAIGGVPSGTYVIAAIDEASKMWAMTTVTVGTQDQAVALTLQPGLSVSGQFVFDGKSPPPSFSRMSVALMPVPVPGGLAIEPESAKVAADGKFTIDGLVPGAYRLWSMLPEADSRQGTGWVLRSAIAGNQDVADLPLDLRAGVDPGRIVATFTDRPTELSGRLQDASGRPASEYFIIVFSPDERMWTRPSRRVMQTRPATDGQFVLRGLPPGEYLLAAVTDIDPEERYDAALLRQLIPGAARLTLAEGDKKVQDIRIAR